MVFITVCEAQLGGAVYNYNFGTWDRSSRAMGSKRETTKSTNKLKQANNRSRLVWFWQVLLIRAAAPPPGHLQVDTMSMRMALLLLLLLLLLLQCAAWNRAYRQLGLINLVLEETYYLNRHVFDGDKRVLPCL